MTSPVRGTHCMRACAGVPSQRARSHLVTARAQPEQIRDLQPRAVVIVVWLLQDTGSTAGRTQPTASYAVTVLTHDGPWKGHDIEPAARNQGGPHG